MSTPLLTTQEVDKMSNKPDISSLYRLEFYKKQSSWCFSRQNITANVDDKMQFGSKNEGTTKRQTKKMVIDTVKTRKSNDLNRNCVTTQFQTQIRKPICEKATSSFQREMISNTPVDVVDGGDTNLSMSVCENDFMDGVWKTAHSSLLNFANYELEEEMNSFAKMQIASCNADIAGFQLDNDQPQELSPDLNQHMDADLDTMSYAELLEAINGEHMHIMHHVQCQQNLMQAICKKVIEESRNDESSPSGDVMYSDISGLPRGRGRINNMSRTPGSAGDCGMGKGRGYRRKC